MNDTFAVSKTLDDCVREVWSFRLQTEAAASEAALAAGWVDLAWESDPTSADCLSELWGHTSKQRPDEPRLCFARVTTTLEGNNVVTRLRNGRTQATIASVG